MREVKVVTFGLLLSFLTLREAQSGCNYFQDVEPGKYYVYNSEYPDLYRENEQCTWKKYSPYTMNVNCTLKMPSSKDCSGDNLSVQFGARRKINRYCGNDTFIDEGPNVTITFNSQNDTQGGKFLCEIRAEKPSHECRCSWKNRALAIVDGNETGVNEFPMMAGLVDVMDKRIYCGATIISTQHVITAAHCVERKNLGELGVVVGDHDTSTGAETNATKLYRVKECMIHPYSSGNQNDIAVCKIKGSITYNDKVSPVCLPFQHSRNSFDDSIVTALGWGLKEFGGEKVNTSQKVKLNVINLSDCKQIYSDITDGNMCIYTPGKGACQIDSGGPVIWENPITHNSVLVGIISNGSCATNEPEVSTRVGYYIDWIQSVTPGVQYCQLE
ncbi:venom serine protease 34 [Harpegnathos saltator]|uniref:venom serine protease 34 n=1 Tax=Harpegnathos saltator TaxID=610380 RepID=UPI000DBEEF12|nr:venom serine protease 34 [Harpegnathos saltator]